MAATQVRHRLVTPDGEPIQGRRLIARLIAPTAWLADHTGEVVDVATATSGDDGWCTLKLTPQSAIAAVDSYYEVQVDRQATPRYCVVPDAGPVQLASILIDPGTLTPTPVPPASVFVLTGDPRLSDTRTPKPHAHPTSDVTGLDTALAGKVDTTDPRLSDARTPKPHAASHATDGSDPITPAAIGAIPDPQEIFLGSTALSVMNGAPNLGHTSSACPAWQLDAAVAEGVGLGCRLPASWNSFDVYVRGVNAGAGSGDVAFRANWGSSAVGANVATSLTGQSPVVILTAGALNVLQEVRVAQSIAVIPGKDFVLRMDRRGADAADTLANDYGLTALILRRVT